MQRTIQFWHRQVFHGVPLRAATVVGRGQEVDDEVDEDPYLADGGSETEPIETLVKQTPMYHLQPTAVSPSSITPTLVANPTSASALITVTWSSSDIPLAVATPAHSASWPRISFSATGNFSDLSDPDMST